jgi:cell division protein FtsB
LRWIGLLVLLVVALGYVQPLRAYRDASTAVAERKAEVTRLAGANVRLEGRIAETQTPEFVEREARKLGLVRPGERLYIVTGIDGWKGPRKASSGASLR